MGEDEKHNHDDVDNNEDHPKGEEKAASSSSSSRKLSFILLVHPEKKVFELVLVSFPTVGKKKKVSLATITRQAKNPLIRTQQYSSFYKPVPNDIVTAAAAATATNNENNALLIAIPDGYDEEQMIQISNKIFKNEKLQQWMARSATTEEQKEESNDSIAAAEQEQGKGEEEKKNNEKDEAAEEAEVEEGEISVIAGKYTIKEFVREGSFGKLYTGGIGAHQSIVIKIIDNEEIAQKEKEMLTKTLGDVPNIVKLYDYVIEKKVVYQIYDTKYVLDVQYRLDNRNYLEHEACCLISILFETVQHIHNHQIVIRNLEPQNIILQKTMNDSTSMLLYNLHFATPLTEEIEGEEPQKKQTICGNVEYTAPEVINGKPYGEKSDIWSIGCILYTMVTRFTPFCYDDDKDKVVDKILNVDYVPFDDEFFNNHFHDDIATLVDNLLVADIEKRWTIKQALECNFFKGLNSDKLIELYFKAVGEISTGKPFSDVYALDDELEKQGEFGVMHKSHYKDSNHGNSHNKLFVKEMERPADDEAAIGLKIILHELRALSEVVLPLYDFKLDSKNLYFVHSMPKKSYILKDMLNDSIVYTEYDVYCICKSLLSTFRDIHTKHRIIHRDVKPENMIIVDHNLTIDDDGDVEELGEEYVADIRNVMLCNFDGAKIIPKNADGLSTFIGTPEYTAPEIITGSGNAGRAYDQSIDMWSMGCVIYILLSQGEAPFGYMHEYGDEADLLYNAIKTLDYNFTFPGFDDVSQEAKHLIHKLLQLDPKERWDASKCMECEWLTTKAPKPASKEEEG